MNRLIIIASLLLLVAFDGWAYNETDLGRIRSLNECEDCDLSGVNLREANLEDANLREADLRGANLSFANLSGVNLTTSKLKKAKLDGAKYCKTKMPWGELNDHCED